MKQRIVITMRRNEFADAKQLKPRRGLTIKSEGQSIPIALKGDRIKVNGKPYIVDSYNIEVPVSVWGSPIISITAHNSRGKPK